MTPKTPITISAGWAGIFVTLVGLLLSGAVSWGVAQSRVSAVELHVDDPAVHVNSELFLYRLGKIERDVSSILQKLP